MSSLDQEAAQLLREYESVKPKNTYLLDEKRIQALKTGDHNTLGAMDQNIATDSEPLYNMIEDQGEKAFNLIQDESGQDVYICSTENAAVWVYATDNPLSKTAASSGENKSSRTVELGVMTKNGGQSAMCILEGLEDIADHITLGALATGIGAVVGKNITAALTKKGAEAAEIVAAGIARDDAYRLVNAAREANDPALLKDAISQLKNARSKVDKLWMKNLPKGGLSSKFTNLATKYPKISGFLGGTIVTILFTIAFEVVWHFINKDLFICARIYNWDTRTWEVDDWYHDNGILVGGGKFEKKQIPASTQTVQKTPWGNKMGKWKPAEYVEYNFQNSFTVCDGIGIALRARSEDGKNGIAMGYYCGFIKDNQLTVKEDYPPSIKDFYWDNKNWPSDWPLQVECGTDGGDGKRTKVTASTNALKGEKNGSYKYIVNIGDASRD